MEVSLAKFLSRYLGVNGIDLKKVRHDEVMELFPFLKRSSWEEIRNNRELVLSGRVLLVNDGVKTLPYYVPFIEEETLNNPSGFEREEYVDKGVDDTYYDYKRLGESKLRTLLARKDNSYRNQVMARKELASRGIELKKKYKRSDYKKISED